MAKRDLFSELVSGFEDLKSEREGKLTLKTTEVARPSPIKITADEIIEIRKSCNQSQAVSIGSINGVCRPDCLVRLGR
jgi:putative transcriptional regulator